MTAGAHYPARTTKIRYTFFMKEHETEITLVNWNILLDYTRSNLPTDSPNFILPQKKRIDAQTAALGQLGVPLDVVCLQEVQGDHGKYIADKLGHDPGEWFNHNTSKRSGEHIGMFGNKITTVEAIQTRHDKLAVATKIGSLAVVGLHNRHEIIGPMRTRQTEDILDALRDEPVAAMMGDVNAVGWQKPHRLIKAAGFMSVFDMVGMPEPKTHPVEAYKSIFYSPLKQTIIPRGTASDRIYVRGCEVIDAGVFESEASDHRGIWATIKPSA